MALYVKLLSLGVEPADAGIILKNVADTKLVLKYKESLIDFLLPDLVATWKELKTKGVTLGMDPSEMLAIATCCNFDAEQEIGY